MEIFNRAKMMMMHFAPEVLGELQVACWDNDVTLRVTPDLLLGLAPLAPARR